MLMIFAYPCFGRTLSVLEVTLLCEPKSKSTKMSEKDRKEAETDDITMTDQEKILRRMQKTDLYETRESPED